VSVATSWAGVLAQTPCKGQNVRLLQRDFRSGLAEFVLPDHFPRALPPPTKFLQRPGRAGDARRVSSSGRVADSRKERLFARSPDIRQSRISARSVTVGPRRGDLPGRLRSYTWITYMKANPRRLV
jgi:hypothetical protein